MPKVTSQVARKDYPDHGIKKGDTYYKWEFRFGGAHKSKTFPRPSQLTQSKMSGAYAAQEALEDALAAATCPNDITSALEACAEEIRSVAEEYEESLNNMPESLQEGPTGQDIQEKVDGLNEWADSFDDMVNEVEQIEASEYREGVDDFDKLTDEEKENFLEAARELVDTDCPI